MIKYVATRLVLMVPAVMGTTLVVFSLTHFLPGDVVDAIFAEFGAGNEAAKDEIRHELGLDQPLLEQYLRWVWDLLRGDLGRSFFRNSEISSDVAEKLPVTLELTLLAQLVSLAVAVPVGVLAAVKRGSLVDQLTRSVAVLFLSIPAFWFAVLFLVLGSVWFHWVPPVSYEKPWSDPLANLNIMIWPALILAAREAAVLTRFVRTTMLDVIGHDYVRTARAKGLSGWAVLVRHALRNALLPVVTVVGLSAPTLVGGAAIAEVIFNLPGMGTYLLRAVQVRDLPVIEAVVLIVALTVMLANLLVDLSYAMLDPRIRYG
jgi:peptide/nickel transport system permease protein